MPDGGRQMVWWCARPGGSDLEVGPRGLFLVEVGLQLGEHFRAGHQRPHHDVVPILPGEGTVLPSP